MLVSYIVKEEAVRIDNSKFIKGPTIFSLFDISTSSINTSESECNSIKDSYYSILVPLFKINVAFVNSIYAFS